MLLNVIVGVYQEGRAKRTGWVFVPRLLWRARALERLLSLNSSAGWAPRPQS